ncbi:hypothetical protein ACJ41O_001058 [Fusarium nematophilum]
MAQRPTESDILAALDRYRTHIGDVSHRAMLRMIPEIETIEIEDPVIADELDEEEVKELRMDYLERLITLPIGNTKPPIERPSDVLKHWDLIAEQVSLNGTTVHHDPEWRATQRNMYRSATLDGLGHFECPTGQWAFPPDLEILMQHVDGLEGHGWAMLRDMGQLVFWKGWGSECRLDKYEDLQKRVMSSQDIMDRLSSEIADYEMAGGWHCGEANESGVYVVYSRPRNTEDESQGWSWRYFACLGQFGMYIFDDIVAALDWYKGQNEPDEEDMRINDQDVFQYVRF